MYVRCTCAFKKFWLTKIPKDQSISASEGKIGRAGLSIISAFCGFLMLMGRNWISRYGFLYAREIKKNVLQ